MFTSVSPAIVTGDDHDTSAAEAGDATNAVIAATATAIIIDAWILMEADMCSALEKFFAAVIIGDVPSNERDCDPNSFYYGRPRPAPHPTFG